MLICGCRESFLRLLKTKKWNVSVLFLEVCLTDSEGAASFLAIEGQ